AILVCVASFEDARDVDTLCARIEGLFDERRSQIRLATVHRTKGLEAERVFILRPDKLPLARPDQQPWQREQELNLKYVALTRAKQSLFFVDQDAAELEAETKAELDEKPESESTGETQLAADSQPESTETTADPAARLARIAALEARVAALEAALTTKESLMVSKLDHPVARQPAARLRRRQHQQDLFAIHAPTPLIIDTESSTDPYRGQPTTALHRRQERWPSGSRRPSSSSPAWAASPTAASLERRWSSTVHLLWWSPRKPGESC
ncbi:MAG: ATP-binding domain-containing protein, partial [Anaerolineae bacterium]|nr:ATP-binding domain-containing protein [Anaerolineae bacterium]